MKWTFIQAPGFTLGLILAFSCFQVLLAQDACSSPAIIDISFPELDPPAVPSTSDPRYAQIILTSGIEPFNLQISSDPDRPNSYTFDEYFHHRFNSFGTPGYYVYMKKGIDRDGAQDIIEDDVNILQYLVVCESTFNNPDKYMSLKIQIIDVNDNPPVFVNAPYEFEVNELTPVGTTVFFSISASDLDEGANKQIHYSLSDSTTSQFEGTQHFILPAQIEGRLSVSSDLDFESMYAQTGYDQALVYYNITITATDQGTPPMSATTSIIIKIKDGDDLGPEFLYPSCIPSTEEFGKACIAPRYKTSVESGSNEQSTLVFTPDPADPSNSQATVDIIMQDRDTLDSSVECVIVGTRPSGYESYFSHETSVYSGKQYKCTVAHKANMPLSQDVDIVIEAVEDSFNHRTEAATIVVQIPGEGNGQQSSTTGCASTTEPSIIHDGDDLGPEFVYPSCIHSTEEFGKTCIAPRYKTSVESGSNLQSTLVFTPDPADPSNSDATVDIIMQDRDNFNSSVRCVIVETRPSGFKSYFSYETSVYGGKQYKCTVTHNANKPLSEDVDIVIEAVEDSINHRTEAATIAVQVPQEANCND